MGGLQFYRYVMMVTQKEKEFRLLFKDDLFELMLTCRDHFVRRAIFLEQRLFEHNIEIDSYPYKKENRMDKATSTKSFASDIGNDGWDHNDSSPNHTMETIDDEKEEHKEASRGEAPIVVVPPIDEGQPPIQPSDLNNNNNERKEDAIPDRSFVGSQERDEEEAHDLGDEFTHNINHIILERGSFVPQTISLCRNDSTPHTTDNFAGQYSKGTSKNTTTFQRLPIRMMYCEDYRCSTSSSYAFSSPLEIIESALQLLDEAAYIINDDN